VQRKVRILGVAGLMFAATIAAQAASVLTLADGTVTANRQDSGTGASSWFGESVTTLTFNAQACPTVRVSGRITDLNPDGLVWAEIGLIPKATWDYWQTAFGGGWKSAVYNKGIYVVNWSSGGLGLSLEENGSSTGPYAWNSPSGLSEPTTASPWEFSITMDPSGGAGGDAELDVTGATLWGTQPFAYSGDYSDVYLIAQLWTSTQNGTFSFTDVKVECVPEPATMCLLAAGGAMWFIRRRRRT
jgi:hypothetical protein